MDLKKKYRIMYYIEIKCECLKSIIHTQICGSATSASRCGMQWELV
jgi:hypothetical protein